MFLKYSKIMYCVGLFFLLSCTQSYLEENSELIPNDLTEVDSPEFTWSNYENVFVNIDIKNHTNQPSVILLKAKDSSLVLKRTSLKVDNDQFDIRLSTNETYSLTVVNSLGQTYHELTPTQSENNFNLTSKLIEQSND